MARFGGMYPNPNALPTVNGMITASGAGYNDMTAYPPFPANTIANRSQTPFARSQLTVNPTPVQPYNQRAGGFVG